MARPSTAAAEAARYIRSSEPAAAKPMLAGYSLAPDDLLARPALEVGGDEKRDRGRLLQAIEEMGDVARRPAVEDEHAQPVVAGECEPALEPRIAVRGCSRRRCRL